MKEKLKWVGLSTFLFLLACAPVQKEGVEENVSYEPEFAGESIFYNQAEERGLDKIKNSPKELENWVEGKIWTEEDFEKDLVYFVDGQKDEPFLFMDGLFEDGLLRNEYLNSADLESLKNLSIIPILEVQNLNYAFDHFYLNKNEILFLVSIDNEKYRNHEVKVYKYFIDQNKVEFLFRMNEYFEQSPYPQIEPSKNNDYIAFLSYGCSECEPGKPEYLLMNTKTQELRGVFDFSAFEWLDDGAYRYKIFEEIECEDDYPFCYKDPQNLPFIYDHF